MNEEEKKAIEILNTFKLRRKTKNYKEISLEDSQSVEIVLNLIEKLQKENELAKQALIKKCNIADSKNQLLRENKELKRENDKLSYENEELKKFIFEGIIIEPHSPYRNYQLDFLRENFIPVQKAKDKIEEYKRNLNTTGLQVYERTIINSVINVLQELIEEREEK